MEIFDFLASIPYLGEVLAGLIAAHALEVFVERHSPGDLDERLRDGKF